MEQQHLDPASAVEPSTGPTTGGEGFRVNFGKYLKDLERLAKALRRLRPSKKPLNDAQWADALGKASVEAKTLDLGGLVAELEAEAAAAAERAKATVDQRRQDLLDAAKASGMFHKRFTEYDRVGPFKVMYKGKKTRLELGSEVASEFEMADGAAVFAEIQQLLAKLEAWPFDRVAFFRMIKSGLRLARDRGQERDGWVPVRALYPHVALLQNLQFEDFLKQPIARRYHDYTTAQFVYDLARFGRRDWSCGDESLRARTPNMATVSAGKAMILPSLDVPEKAGEQFATLRIERSGPSGAESGTGAVG